MTLLHSAPTILSFIYYCKPTPLGGSLHTFTVTLYRGGLIMLLTSVVSPESALVKWPAERNAWF